MERITEDALEDTKGTNLEGIHAGDDEEKQLQEVASSLVASVRSQQRFEEAPHSDLDLNETDIDDINHSHGLNSPVKPLVQRTRKLLFRRLRVSVIDGRIFVGKFHCLDKQGNIILYDTVEYRQASPSGGAASETTEQRNLGLVLIPAQHRTSLFVEASLSEQFSVLSL